jgi:transcriptional regulator with XRE-family HTH domain
MQAVEASKQSGSGDRLRRLRTSLGITTRGVEELSRRVAKQEGNEEFYISNAWLTQIENRHSLPSIYKIISLSIIYRTSLPDLLLIFGVDLEKIAKYQSLTQLNRTHLTNLQVYDSDRSITFPVRFDPGFTLERTSLLSRMVETWGEVPIAVIQHLDLRRSQYGYIGLEDYTMYPLIRPGTFVQVDERANRIQKSSWRTEFDRPIYFVELRHGYACSWCEMNGNHLSLVPHPLSPAAIRHFNYPNEVEIVGRVTAVAMRIVDEVPNSQDGRPARHPALPR